MVNLVRLALALYSDREQVSFECRMLRHFEINDKRISAFASTTV